MGLGKELQDWTTGTDSYRQYGAPNKTIVVTATEGAPPSLIGNETPQCPATTRPKKDPRTPIYDKVAADFGYPELPGKIFTEDLLGGLACGETRQEARQVWNY